VIEPEESYYPFPKALIASLENDLYEKFSECASFVFSQDEVDEIYDEIRNIDKLADLTELTQLLSARAQHG
jgi:cell division protein FtsX